MWPAGSQPVAAVAAFCRPPRGGLVAGLGDSRIRSAGQGAGRCGAFRTRSTDVRSVATGSRPALAEAAPAARVAAHRPDQPSLVCLGVAGGRTALLGQLFWLPQPSTVHLRGERSPPALVVFRPGDGRGGPALHALFAVGVGAGAPIPDRSGAFVASIRSLLAFGGAAAVHHRSHQAPQLLVARHPRGGSVGGPSHAGLIALATDGLGNLPGANCRAGRWVLAGIALGSLDRRSGDADAVGGFAGQRSVELGCGLVQRCRRAWSLSVASASCCR